MANLPTSGTIVALPVIGVYRRAPSDEVRRVNQIGSVSETMAPITFCQDAGYTLAAWSRPID